MADISLAPGSLTYRENGDAIALDANAILSNFEGLGDLGGYVLELSLTGAIESDRLIVSETGSIQLDGRRVLLANQQIASFIQTYDPDAPLLTLTLSSGTTANQLEALIRSLAYVNVSDALVDGSRTVNLTLKSGQGQVEAAAGRSLQVTAIDDRLSLLSPLTLYDGSSAQLPDEAGAAPDGPWLYFLDLTKVPEDYPSVSIPFPLSLVAGSEIDLAGTPIQSGTNAALSLAQQQGVNLATDAPEAYAGLSNYRFNFENSDEFNEIINGTTATFDIELEPVSPNFPALDRSEGYVLSFTSELIAEARETSADKNGDGLDDRAGLSVIVIGNDQKGIELGFWSDRIWAQNDGTQQTTPSREPDTPPIDAESPFQTLFTQGESVSYNTRQVVDYDLSVKGDLYTLFANNDPILTGELRDYSQFDPPEQNIEDTDDQFPVINDLRVLPPNPYAQPNFIFLGDNTPTAAVSFDLRDVSIQTQPASNDLTVSSAVFPTLSLQDLDLDEGRSQLTLSVQNGTLNIGSPVNGGISSEDTSGNGTSQLLLTGTREQLNTTLNANVLSYSGNGSETLDLDVVPEGLSGEISLYRRESVHQIKDGVISTEPLRPFIRDQNWQLQTSGNFSGGDAEDLIWHNIRTGQVVLWNDVNTSATALPSVTDKRWQVVGNGRFNNDSTSDLLWYNRETQAVRVWYMNSGEVGDRLSLSLSDSASTALQNYDLQGSGDFDGDGNIDLLWVEGYGTVDLLPAPPASRVKLSSITNGEITGVVDIDAPHALGTRLEWQTHLARDPNLPVISGQPLALVQGVGDYNGDGREDLIIGSGTTPSSLWLMNGASAPQVIALS